MKKDYKTFLYGAYGSNLNKNQMSFRCPASKPVGTYCLEGWELVFRGVADIVESADSAVSLGLWRITNECLAALDRYEGYPSLYTRFIIPEANIMIYQMTSSYPIRPPAKQYLDTIVEGYKDFSIDEKELIPALQNSYIKENVIARF